MSILISHKDTICDVYKYLCKYQNNKTFKPILRVHIIGLFILVSYCCW